MKRVFFGICALCLLLSPIYAFNIGEIRIASLLNLGEIIPTGQMADNSVNQATIAKLLKTPIPNGTGNFTQIIESVVIPTKNKTPDFAFIGLGAKKQLGVYYSQAGKLTPIVGSLTEIPGGTGYFQSAHDLSVFGENNQIAFIGQGILNQQGVYIYNGKTLINGVDQRSITPNKNALFVQFFHLGSSQDILVFSTMTDNRIKAIYGYQTGNTFKIIAQNDLINKQKVTDLSMPQNALNGKKLFFSATFPNKQQVSYLATLDFI